MDNLRESRERDFYRDTASPNLAVAKPLRFSHYPCRPNGRMKIKKIDNSQPTYFFQYLTRPQMDKKNSHKGVTESLSISGSKHFFSTTFWLLFIFHYIFLVRSRVIYEQKFKFRKRCFYNLVSDLLKSGLCVHKAKDLKKTKKIFGGFLGQN